MLYYIAMKNGRIGAAYTLDDAITIARLSAPSRVVANGETVASFR